MNSTITECQLLGYEQRGKNICVSILIVVNDYSILPYQPTYNNSTAKWMKIS